MKKITVQSIASRLEASEKLVRAVIRQSGGLASFLEKAPDIARHGINGGFGGWIYYSETEPFAFRNRHEIQRLAEDQADAFGSTVSEMVRGFGQFRNSKEKPTEAEIWRALTTGKDESGWNLSNLFAWYAAEEVARTAYDLIEENE